MPTAWIHSILREGLRRAAGLRRPTHIRSTYGRSDPRLIGWHSEMPFDAPPESLAAWGNAYNELIAVEAMATEQEFHRRLVAAGLAK